MGSRYTPRDVALRVIAASVFFLPAAAGAQAPKPARDESLLLGDIPSVFGASRFDQAETEAPASVSIITADEIATYGWLTLGDALRTVRGFFTTNDRSYTYVGTRGFARPGDYNSRILILLDGVRVNDNIYDGGYVALESMVDMSTVERIEVIRGPASSLYGTNAFFGIVNVITQRGRTRPGTMVAGNSGSFGAREGALTAGGRTAHGLEFLGSVSRRQDRGQNLFYQEFASPQTNNGWAVGRDGESRDHAFGKLTWGAWTLESTLNMRDKRIPTASYGSDFNIGKLDFTDQSRNVALRYEQSQDERSGLSGSVSLSRYDYNGVYPYGTDGQSEYAHGRWGVADVQYTRLIAGRHRIVAGAQFTDNFRQEQSTTVPAGAGSGFYDNTKDNTQGLFALGEFRLGDNVIFNGGLRFDHSPSIGSTLNPRGALIYTFGPGSALKALYGNAFREANSFERFYRDDRTQEANPFLMPERVTTFEVLVEHVVSSHVKVTASVYRYQATRLIDLVTDPRDSLLQYTNLGRANGQGLEAETDLDFGRITGKASYALQRAWSPDTRETLSNSPQHLGAVNLSMPVVSDRATVGLEVRGMSSRCTPHEDYTKGYLVANAVVSSRRLFRGMQSSVGVFNLFDSPYRDPVGEEHVQSAIQQDGRSFRATLAYVF